MIDAQNLSLKLAGTPILRDVSVTLHPGEVLALCGPNGAGKSTLLSCLAGEHRSCRQNVRYSGQPLSTLSPAQQAKRRVVLEQTPTLSADFNVAELIELGVAIELPGAELSALKQDLMARLGLEGFDHRPVSSLSGGQRHRVHMARVLLQLKANRYLGHECFLFLDEPTASLDLGHQITTLNLIRGLSEEGVGVLVVLHDLNLAAAFADRIVLLQEGQVKHTGKPTDILTTDILSAVYQTEIYVGTSLNGQKIIQPVMKS